MTNLNMSDDETLDNFVYPAIAQLIAELRANDICPRCIAFGLIYHGATMFEMTVSNSEAARLCETIADGLREEPIQHDAPECGARH